MDMDMSAKDPSIYFQGDGENRNEAVFCGDYVVHNDCSLKHLFARNLW